MSDAISEYLDDDPFSVETLSDPIPFDAKLREAAPLVRLRRYDVWATGRHTEVESVFRDWRTFSSASGTGLRDIKKSGNWRKPSVILDADPPAHTRTRAVLTRVLSASALRELRERFEAEARRLVRTVVARGSFDAVRDLAEAFPLTVLPDAVGMAPEGREHLLPYANLNFQAMGPRNQLYDDAVADAESAREYVAWQMRREALSADGFGARIYAAADRDEITQDEAAFLVRSFLSAGVDTTILGIGSAIHALATRPEQWALLREDPALARQTFEETLRYGTPSPIIGRTTTCETAIGDQQVAAEQKVLLFLGAANRDPRRWDDPDSFDLRRRPRGHLAFGHGIHGCVGQLIARMEADCVLSALAREASGLELDGQPRLKLSNWLRGFAALPVRVTPA